MKALLKNGEWVEIDTACLFNNQYNTKDGKATGIRAYRLYNCRHDYTFRFENGELFTDKYSFGWHKVKTLEGVPASVMEAVKNICRR